MADIGKNRSANNSGRQGNETALMIEGLYNGIAYDLHKLKTELGQELKYSSKQVTAAFQAIEEISATSGQSSKEEISAICDSLKEEMAQLKSAMEENANLSSTELKYGYHQNQMIFESLSATLDEIKANTDGVKDNEELIKKVEDTVAELSEKIAAIEVNEPDYGAIAETVKEKVMGAMPKAFSTDELAEAVKDKVLASLPLPEETDYDKIVEQVSEKTEASVLSHSKEVLDAVSAMPVPENIDYTRLVEEVSDKVMEKLGDYLATEWTAERLQKMLPQEDKTDYDRVIYGTAEKVVESLPYPEKIDYNRIAEERPVVDEDALAEKVAQKIAMPEMQIDYDLLAEKLAQKMVMSDPQIDYDLLAEKLAEKITIPEMQPATYDIVVDEEGAQAIADKVVVPVPEKTEIDYAILADEFAQRMPASSYEMLLDESGADMIATAVAEKLQNVLIVEKTEETPVAEEVVEQAEETPVAEEVATEIALADVTADIDYDDESQLTNAESGLVIRLKRSFAAKLRQSAPEIKGYYGTIKNELNSYKRLNSNVSWHGDRFNYGRETVAKMTINGKTLCFYLALDPSNPDFKTTVFHQKDLSAQKAYENTPFMVKVKSETGAKRAVRLVTALAEKLGATKDEGYENIDYEKIYPTASTNELIDEGLIKVTKEKKVVLNFN